MFFLGIYNMSIKRIIYLQFSLRGEDVLERTRFSHLQARSRTIIPGWVRPRFISLPSDRHFSISASVGLSLVQSGGQNSPPNMTMAAGWCSAIHSSLQGRKDGKHFASLSFFFSKPDCLCWRHFSQGYLLLQYWKSLLLLPKMLDVHESMYWNESTLFISPKSRCCYFLEAPLTAACNLTRVFCVKSF